MYAKKNINNDDERILFDRNIGESINEPCVPTKVFNHLALALRSVLTCFDVEHTPLVPRSQYI